MDHEILVLNAIPLLGEKSGRSGSCPVRIKKAFSAKRLQHRRICLPTKPNCVVFGDIGRFTGKDLAENSTVCASLLLNLPDDEEGHVLPRYKWQPIPPQLDRNQFQVDASKRTCCTHDLPD